jgi:RTX calcium-binding nonapeptide repeat (4 copies)
MVGVALLVAGGVALVATITCPTIPGTIQCNGTPEDNRLPGTDEPDIMRGLLGDDVLVGSDGGDSMLGDDPAVGPTTMDGNDTLRGGAGEDGTGGMTR